MLRKDYIQRQFEEFGKVMAILLSLKRNKDWDNFEKELSEISKRFTPFDIETLERLSETDFQSELQSAKLSFGQKKMLASLLFEKLDAYLEKGETENYPALKARCVYLYHNLASDLTQNEYDLEVHYRLGLLSH